MLLKVERPKLPKSFLAPFIRKSKLAQFYFFNPRQKLPPPARPIVKLRPCLQTLTICLSKKTLNKFTMMVFTIFFKEYMQKKKEWHLKVIKIYV